MSINKEQQGPISGFRDALPEVMMSQNGILDKIKHVYESYGFMPLDTPVVEKLDTLRGKAGEGDKIIYLVKSGMEDPDAEAAMGLRFDLTVPLARVMTQYEGQIPLPFKRYHVGKVWRGDRPQKGRFREFAQFDADTVGSASVLADSEIVAMMSDSMHAIGVESEIRVNNRRILDAVVETAGVSSEEGRGLITIIDKTEKNGVDAVVSEVKANYSSKASEVVYNYLHLPGSAEEKLSMLSNILNSSEALDEGLNNLQAVFSMLRSAGYSSEEVVFDQTIARGLNYYTGIIYETMLKDLPKLGSVCSGGRYDHLIKDLGGPDLPAVGTSIGVDRLFTALQMLGKIESTPAITQAMIINFSEQDAPVYMGIASGLRKAGIPTEIYLDPKKLKVQMSFVDKAGIPFVILAGPDELSTNRVNIKNMKTRQQTTVSLEEIVNTVQNFIEE